MVGAFSSVPRTTIRRAAGSRTAVTNSSVVVARWAVDDLLAFMLTLLVK
jgi:hypothetical protein